MQYGLDIGEYKKSGTEKKKFLNLREEPIILMSILIGGLLISRVIIYLNRGSVSGIAPFGIAYLIAVMIRKNEKRTLIATLGVGIGYFTISSSITGGYINILAVGLLMIYNIVFSRGNKAIKEMRMFLLVLISFFAYGFFISKYDLGINITLSLINTVVIVPVYYVVRYGVNCIEEFNTNYFFSTEEIISMGIVLCLIVSGVGNLNIMDISLRAVLSYTIILLVAFVGGGAYGAAIGVSMGVIVGMSTGDMTLSIAFYSIAGLIAGIFKDTGKLFAFLSYLIMYLALALYSQNLNIASIIEAAISGVVFLMIPKSILKLIEVEINTDKKRDQVNEIELTELKKEFSIKVKDLGSALSIVSNTLQNIGDNDKLMYKNKSTALIENLADRVCSNCSKCENCWSRDFNFTYNSLQKLIKSCEDKQVIFPDQLEKICLKKFDLIKGAEKIVDNLNNNEAMKGRLEEGRLILADHIKNISMSIDEMLRDFKKDVMLCGDLERLVRRGLNKSSIQYKNVFSYRDTNGRVKIKLTLENCGGGKYCSKNVLPIINELMRKPMCLGGDGCRIDPDNGECTMIFEEAPKFHVVSYGAISPKEGEEYTGDTYSFGKTKDGLYMSLISDGMGSGPEAGKESRATVEIVEKFVESGFGKETAINMVNSIMSMKFEEDERFSTLDLNVIDLYSGEASFMKVGAVASFIKRGKSVKPIISNMPPFGLVDKIEVEEVKLAIKNGDLIVILSDGILDVTKESVGKYNWLEEYLEGASKDPKELAGDILDKAKALSGGSSKDDMTVVVSKVYSMY
ncbi:stage II sporulation protein E [Clostridium sp. LP20]|uniref:stage II sporulation protein E n=1 Tax=Clostridium sp. LP20 TaxID=3418665 RepID=UPI003EE4287A